MAEKKTTRRRRSTATLERLEAARRRRVAQLERARENERRVDEALGPFAEAATAIEAVERKRDERVEALATQLERKLAELERQKAAKVAEYERLTDEARAVADREIADRRTVMGAWVRQIREADVSVTDAAAMLGISTKMVTALTRTGAEKSTSEMGTSDTGRSPDSPAEQEAASRVEEHPVVDATAGAVGSEGQDGETAEEVSGPVGWETGLRE